MSEIEKAIRFLEKNRDAIQDKDNQLIPQAIKDEVSVPYELAIQALQEKAEREKHPNGWIPVSDGEYKVVVKDGVITECQDLKI